MVWRFRSGFQNQRRAKWGRLPKHAVAAGVIKEQFCTQCVQIPKPPFRTVHRCVATSLWQPIIREIQLSPHCGDNLRVLVLMDSTTKPASTRLQGWRSAILRPTNAPFQATPTGYAPCSEAPAAQGSTTSFTCSGRSILAAECSGNRSGYWAASTNRLRCSHNIERETTTYDSTSRDGFVRWFSKKGIHAQPPV